MNGESYNSILNLNIWRGGIIMNFGGVRGKLWDFNRLESNIGLEYRNNVKYSLYYGRILSLRESEYGLVYTPNSSNFIASIIFIHYLLLVTETANIRNR